MSEFIILSPRQARTVRRGLSRVQSGMQLVAAIMATGIATAAIRSVKPKRRTKRKTTGK